MSLGLVCPACRTPLLEGRDDWCCPACPRRFPSHHGIPDLRLAGDAYLSLEQDRARADLVVAAFEGHDLRGLLEHYWSRSAETPAALRARFVASALRASLRARHLVACLRAEGFLVPTARVLEVGSGTAAFLTEATPHAQEVIGLDLALRWLHVGRRRLLDAGVAKPALVGGAGEALPFEDRRFDLVVCVATLEFTRDPDRVLAECARVLRPGGTLVLNTVNRFSLLLEPHVGLWGVGFLPRAWQAPYVRWRGRGDFSGVTLLARRELQRLASRHFENAILAPADLPEALGRGKAARLALRGYGHLRDLAPSRFLLRRLGPEWDARLRKP